MMKPKIFLFAVSLALGGLVSCELLDLESEGFLQDQLSTYLEDVVGVSFCESGVDTTASALPANAQTYIQQNYPQDSISSVSLFSSNAQDRYQVSMSNEDVLVFDEQGSFLGGGTPVYADEDDFEEDYGQASNDSVAMALNTFFDEYEVESIALDFDENGDSVYVVEFDEDIFVSFDNEGTAQCFSIEDDDDEEHDDGDEEDNDEDHDDEEDDDDDDDENEDEDDDDEEDDGN